MDNGEKTKMERENKPSDYHDGQCWRKENEGYCIIPVGTRVITLSPNNRIFSNRSNAVLNSRKWGIQGNIVAYNDANDVNVLYYKVLHVDGSTGYYDPSEIIVFSEPVAPKHKNGYENVITAEEARKITSESIIKSIDIQPYLNVIHYSIRNAAKDGKSFIRERMDKWSVLIPPSTESKIEICKVLIEEGYNIKSVAGLNQTNPEELGMYEDIEISW